MGLNLYLFFWQKTFQLTVVKVYILKLWQCNTLEAVHTDDLDISVSWSGVIDKV